MVTHALTVKFLVIMSCALHLEDTHMIKLRKLSEYGADTVIASIVMMVVVGLFLLISYLFVKTL